MLFMDLFCEINCVFDLDNVHAKSGRWQIMCRACATTSNAGFMLNEYVGSCYIRETQEKIYANSI